MIHCCNLLQLLVIVCTVDWLFVLSSEVQYYCESDVIQLISTNELTGANVQFGSNFHRVIETSHYVGENSGDFSFFWEGHRLPNSGNFTFRKPFVLIAMTTAGEYFSRSNRALQYYVQNFTMHYSDSLNSSFVRYPNDFIASNPDEKLYYFNKSLVFQRLQLFINNGTRVDGYDLRIVLIGCPLANASIVLPSSSSNVITLPQTSPVICDTNAIPSMPAEIRSFPSTTLISPISTITITKSARESTVTITVQPTITALSNTSCQEITAVFIVPMVVLFVIIILVVLFSITIGICCYKLGTKNKKEPLIEPVVRERSSKEIYTVPINEKEDYNMTYNALYLSSLSINETTAAEVSTNRQLLFDSYEEEISATYEVLPGEEPTYEMAPKQEEINIDNLYDVPLDGTSSEETIGTEKQDCTVIYEEA